MFAIQLLRMFLESEAPLKENEDWNKAQTKSSGLFAGLVKGVKKAIGTESSIPTPSQVQSTASHEVDIMRMLSEQKIPRRRGSLLGPFIVQCIERNSRPDHALLERALLGRANALYR